jgi:16S rRNA (adenine1518-N6/adenine1519-N6)-dimethyltransferase
MDPVNIAPDDPRRLLAELEQVARKRFGQHFLTDRGVVDRIVRGARVAPGDPVVEVGPGLGILTRGLLAAGARVTAVEIDRDLANWIRASFQDVALIEADAARLDWAAALPGGGWKMVANLPYNVGTTVVMDALRATGTFASITVMLQLEVVQRLCAGVGDEAYGALSVEVAARARATFLTSVPPDRFHPPPKVTSAVVRLEPHDAPAVGSVRPADFDKVVRAAFGQRRKTLLNAVGSVYGRERAAEALRAAGIEPTLRAERLDLDGFRSLAAALVSPGDRTG